MCKSVLMEIQCGYYRFLLGRKEEEGKYAPSEGDDGLVHRVYDAFNLCVHFLTATIFTNAAATRLCSLITILLPDADNDDAFRTKANTQYFMRKVFLVNEFYSHSELPSHQPACILSIRNYAIFRANITMRLIGLFVNN